MGMMKKKFASILEMGEEAFQDFLIEYGDEMTREIPFFDIREMNQAEFMMHLADTMYMQGFIAGEKNEKNR